MSKVIGIMVVKNEGSRFLRAVLGQLNEFCDRLLIMDDASTDDTVAICERYGAKVYSSRGYGSWEKNEVALRKAIWNKAVAMAKPGDWIFCLDADETFDKPEKMYQLLKAAEATTASDADALGFGLYDMWSMDEYRDDELWNAHNRVFTMAVKYNPDRQYVWNEQALHCGRFPSNAASYVIYCPSIRIQHWGWASMMDRLRKYERYMRLDPEGELGSLAQYKSILDPEPTLRRFA